MFKFSDFSVAISNDLAVLLKCPLLF